APGEAVRFLLLKTHYRGVLDFSTAALAEAKRELDRFYRALEKHADPASAATPPAAFIEALADDLNTPGAIAELHALADAAMQGDAASAAGLRAAGMLIGIFNHTADQWFRGEATDDARIDALIAERLAARRNKDFARADAIRAELAAAGILLEDGPGGTTWRRA
ncbi:MAG: cysteine--tRNA ligase, partial [Rhodospirillales bacterium]|nr:cysteine--tRNA ligase [Rhodospirillales bacterium]